MPIPEPKPRIKRLLEFRPQDAVAFVDSFRFGCRMAGADLEARIAAERSSGSLGPAGLRGLEVALTYLRTGAMPSVVRFEVDGPDPEAGS